MNRVYATDLDNAWEEIPLLHPECIDEIREEIILYNKQFLNLFETVQLLRLHVETIKTAIIKGRLKAYRLDSGEWQIPLEEVNKAEKNDLRSS